MSQTEKLNEIVGNFLAQDLEWVEPLDLESEPSYTGRCIFPQLEKCLKEINEPKLLLRSDNSMVGRPRPVLFGGQRFFPDLSFELSTNRSLAIEVKFLKSDNFSGSVATAIGQAFVYKSLGYDFSHVVMVAKATNIELTKNEVLELSVALNKHGVGFHLLR